MALYDWKQLPAKTAPLVRFRTLVGLEGRRDIELRRARLMLTAVNGAGWA